MPTLFEHTRRVWRFHDFERAKKKKKKKKKWFFSLSRFFLFLVFLVFWFFLWCELHIKQDDSEEGRAAPAGIFVRKKNSVMLWLFQKPSHLFFFVLFHLKKKKKFTKKKKK
jgi:hypothetical protein